MNLRNWVPLAPLVLLSGYKIVWFDRNLSFWHIILIVIFLLLVLRKKLACPPWFLAISFFLSLHFFFASWISGKIFLEFFFQIIPFGFAIVTLYSAVRSLGVIETVRIFEFAAVVLGVSVLFQSGLALFLPARNEFLQTIGFFGRDGGNIGPFLRAPGLLAEPSWVGIWVTPALVLTVLRYRFRASLVLLGATILSFSGLAFLGLVFVVIFLTGLTATLRQAKAGVFFLVFFFTVSVVFLGGTSAIQSRVQNSLSAIPLISNDVTPETQTFVRLGGSVGTLAGTSLIARESLLETSGFGFGFGTFRQVRFIAEERLPHLDFTARVFHNERGGGSLLLRMVVEIGAFVIFFVAWFFYSLTVLFRKALAPINGKEAWAGCIIATYALLVLCLVLIRKDSYFHPSFVLPLVILTCFTRHWRHIDKK